jgi:hypothetical protein
MRLGWSLCQTGKCAEAETHLRKSIELSRTEQNLSHFAEILGKTRAKRRSEQIAIEANSVYRESIQKTFKKETAKDFELNTIDGRKVKLSDLKGKVVMVDFGRPGAVPVLNQCRL